MQFSEGWMHLDRSTSLALSICILVSLGIFGVLAWNVIEHGGLSFDLPILLSVHRHASPALDGVMIFLTRVGSAFFLVPCSLLIVVVLAYRRRRRATVFWLLAVGGAILLNVPIKHAVARVRPHLWLSELPETTFSFPSGHAVQSMAVVAALVLLSHRNRNAGRVLAAGVPFVFLVGLSRVYLGVHYPSDVLAGWAASLVWVCSLRLVLGRPVGGSGEMPSGPE